MLPTIGSGFFTIGVFTLFNAMLNYLGMAYSKYAASVFAGSGSKRAIFGAVFPLFVSLHGSFMDAMVGVNRLKGKSYVQKTWRGSGQLATGWTHDPVHPYSFCPLHNMVVPVSALSPQSITTNNAIVWSAHPHG